MTPGRRTRLRLQLIRVITFGATLLRACRGGVPMMDDCEAAAVDLLAAAELRPQGVV